MDGSDKTLGRRELLRRAGVAGVAAGLVWSAPQVAHAAPAPVGSPSPTESTEVLPPEVLPNVIEPTLAEPTVAGVSVRPGPQPEAPLSILGLASTGADIATMAAAGVASVSAGTLLHRAGTRRGDGRGARRGGHELGRALTH